MSKDKTRTFENISATPVGKRGCVAIFFRGAFAGKVRPTKGGGIIFLPTFWPQRLVLKTGGLIAIPVGRITNAALAATRKKRARKERVRRPH